MDVAFNCLIKHPSGEWLPATYLSDGFVDHSGLPIVHEDEWRPASPDEIAQHLRARNLAIFPRRLARCPV